MCWSQTAKGGASSLVLPKRTKEGERGDSVGHAVRWVRPSMLPVFSSSFVSFGHSLSLGERTSRSSERAPAGTPSGNADAPGGWLPSLTLALACSVNTTTSQLQEAIDRLAAETSQQRWDYRALAAHLESLASMFARTSRDQHREIVAQFHDCAGKLPYIDDCDFGALVLENAANAVADGELRALLLCEARFRASWCVQSSTAGGEAIARAVHLRRIAERVQNAG